jgi:beta-hydroxylase
VGDPSGFELDKLGHPPRNGSILTVGGNRKVMMYHRSSRLLAAFRSTASGGDDGTVTTRDRALRSVAFGLARGYARLVRRVAGGEIFLSTNHRDWVRPLESNWQAIRDEFDRLNAAFAVPALIDVISGERSIADARWKAFIFCHFGRRIERNCSLCPRTTALLQDIPGLLSAEFSLLEPGARIAPHQGIYAGTIRYHLALRVPQDADLCRLRVDDETRGWREGGSLLFDDTHRHEAWNLTDESRVVLVIDVRRPLPVPLRWINDAVLFGLSRFIMRPLVHADRAVPQPREAAAGDSSETR